MVPRSSNSPRHRVAGIEFAPQNCVSLDIAPLFERTSDLDISGILGYDFLSRFVTRVDYAREELTLYDPELFEYAVDGARVEASLVGDTFAVPVSVDGVPAGRWAVDLGEWQVVPLSVRVERGDARARGLRSGRVRRRR